MEILDRQKITPITMVAGDKLHVTWDDNSYVKKWWWQEKKVPVRLAEFTLDIDNAMTVDEVILFADIFEGRRTLGGMVIEQKNVRT